MREASQFQGGDRSVLRGFEDDRASRGKSRPDLDAGGEQRDVPGRYCGDNPDGLECCEHVHAVVNRDGAALRLVGKGGEPLVVLRLSRDAYPQVPNDAAAVLRFQRRQFRHRVAKKVGEAYSKQQCRQ